MIPPAVIEATGRAYQAFIMRNQCEPERGSPHDVHGEVAQEAPDVDLLLLGRRPAQALQEPVCSGVHQPCVALQALAEEGRLPRVAQAPVICAAARSIQEAHTPQ